jgi:hypothetical protein
MRNTRKMSQPIMPPPMVEGTEDLRTMLARTALGNVSLMKGITCPREAVRLALQVADEMIRALNNTAPPVIEHLSEAELQHWERVIGEQRAREGRLTQPAVPSSKREQAQPVPDSPSRRVTLPYIQKGIQALEPGTYRHITPREKH